MSGTPKLPVFADGLCVCRTMSSKLKQFITLPQPSLPACVKSEGQSKVKVQCLFRCFLSIHPTWGMHVFYIPRTMWELFKAPFSQILLLTFPLRLFWLVFVCFSDSSLPQAAVANTFKCIQYMTQPSTPIAPSIPGEFGVKQNKASSLSQSFWEPPERSKQKTTLL